MLYANLVDHERPTCIHNLTLGQVKPSLSAAATLLVPSSTILRYIGLKDSSAGPRLGALSIDFSRLILKTFRIRLVRALKSLRKPFTLWPVIVAFARPFRTLALHGPRRAQFTPKLKNPCQHGPYSSCFCSERESDSTPRPYSTK